VLHLIEILVQDDIFKYINETLISDLFNKCALLSCEAEMSATISWNKLGFTGI
jgi:hypothetical protein